MPKISAEKLRFSILSSLPGNSAASAITVPGKKIINTPLPDLRLLSGIHGD